MSIPAKLVGGWCAGLACLMAGRAPAQTYDWQPPPNKVTLLAVWAHPDDEGIFGGGSLPYYSSVLDVPTMLVCMTYNLTDERGGELCCAAWNYGLRYQPVMGGFTDINSSTITNSFYGTNTIDITWDWWAGIGYQGNGSDVAAGKTRAINYVAEQIRRYRPDVIITHDVNGETGHDNHKATSYAVRQAFSVAADPTANATNLIGLAPWQAQKLYVHLYSTNRLFHEFWETPYPVLTNLTSHQVVNTGLTCHVSQGPSRWISASVYPPVGVYAQWPAEWWGLYASMVGPDTVLSSNTVAMGYPVPSGVAAENFLEHLAIYQAPSFTVNPLLMPQAATSDAYTGQTLANYVITTDPLSTLTFAKVSGPAWLNVAPDGTLSGTPVLADAGTNSWLVNVTNQYGMIAQTTLTIPLLGRAVGMENLMGWWKLNETNPASPVASNSAPLSPDGVCYGGTIFGQAGARSWTHSAVQFDGTDGKIDVPYTAILNPPVFTVALWANVTGGSGTNRSPLTNRKSQPQAGYIFYAGMNGLWQFWTGNSNSWNILTAGPVVTNTWIHLAATYDGTNACFYTNGTLAAATNIAIQLNDKFPLRIGAGATEAAGDYWFPGLVDDVRVYRAALDALHVWALCVNPPVISSIQKQSNGAMLLSGSAIPVQTYILLTSPIRGPGAAWVPIATNASDTNGNIQFIDANAINYAQRFYRLILQ